MPIEADDGAGRSDWIALQWMAASRVAVALALLVFGIGDRLRHSTAGLTEPGLFGPVSAFYLLAAIAFFVGLRLVRQRFREQLFIHALTDLGAIALMMHASKGLAGGFGVLMIAPVAAAAVLSTTRMSAFFAAVASLLLLFEAVLGLWGTDPDRNSLPMIAGLIGAACFVTAMLVNWLALRLRRQEHIAIERGANLRNQLAVTQRVIVELEQGVVVMASDGEVRTMNPAARMMLGLGEQGSASVALTQLIRAASLWRSRGASPNERQELLLAPAQRTGEQPRVQLRLLSTPGGDAVLMLEDLRRAEERAQQLKLASMGRLSASIAHEIRNPLGAIRHANALLGERLENESNQRLSRIIEDNTLRIDRVIGDVLSVSRRERPAEDAIDMHAFLQTFTDEFSAQVGVRRERIALKMESTQPMRFDASNLRQVLVNLVGNALRYASDAPGAVILTWREKLPDRLELLISDDGPGLSAEMREHVFEPFFTTEARGTGLGLYLARELCSANGALLRYETGSASIPTGFVIEPRVVSAST